MMVIIPNPDHKSILTPQCEAAMLAIVSRLMEKNPAVREAIRELAAERARQAQELAETTKKDTES